MIKRSTILATMIWMLLGLAAGGAMFLLKYQMQAEEERLAELKEAIVADMEAIHVLKAEWAYLNQPARLEDLGRRYLALDVAASSRIVTISEIPFPSPIGKETETPAAREASKPPQAADHKVTPRLATYTAQ